jgi:hypothetical protein
LIGRTVWITGAAKRVGQAMAWEPHAARTDSALCLATDWSDRDAPPSLVGRLRVIADTLPARAGDPRGTLRAPCVSCSMMRLAWPAG